MSKFKVGIAINIKIIRRYSDDIGLGCNVDVML